MSIAARRNGVRPRLPDTSESTRVLAPALAIALLLLTGVTAHSQSGTPTVVATITYPANGATSVDLSQPIQWTTVPNAQAYVLYLGTQAGANDLHNGNEIQATSFRVMNLPPGAVVYARMWAKVADVWRYTDSSFTLAPLAYLTFPNAGATLGDMSQSFQWTTVPNAQAYYLYVGSSIGAMDLVNTREIHVTSYPMPNLPPGVAYARMWLKIAGVWRYTDSTFTVPPIAYLTYPNNGSNVADLSQSLRWTAVANAQAYYLYIGTTPGAKDLVNTGEIQQTSQSIGGLPRGRTVYARLWTKAGNVWRYVDSTFSTGPAIATLTYPTAGASNVDLTRPFTWTAVPGAQAYYLYVGSAVGASDIVNSRELQQTSFTTGSTWYGHPASSVAWDQPNDSWFISGFAMSVDGGRIDLGLPSPMPCTDPADFDWCYRSPLPPLSPGSHQIQLSAYNEIGETTGTPVTLTMADPLMYVRLWTKLANVWYYVDSAFSASNLAARFVYPAFAAPSVDVTQPLTWTPIPNAEAYSLKIGLVPGGNELLDVANLQTTSFQANGLTSLSIDRRVFARLGTKVQGVWRYSETMFGIMPLAKLTSPANGEIDVPTAHTFYWSSPAANVQAYYLYVGTSPGNKDVVNSRETLAQSYRAENLPAGTTLYARLWTKIAGVWRYVDSQFSTERDPSVCPCSLWTLSTRPGPIDPDRNAVELGMRFTSDISGVVTGIRFYKYGQNTGPHVGNLWTAGGTRLRTVTFANETDSGWQLAMLSTPIHIEANTTYIVSYHTTTGAYASTVDGFADGRNRGPLHALSSGSTVGNGVHHYATTSAFPDTPWNENYWVDVIFMPQ